MKEVDPKVIKNNYRKKISNLSTQEVPIVEKTALDEIEAEDIPDNLKR